MCCKLGVNELVVNLLEASFVFWNVPVFDSLEANGQ